MMIQKTSLALALSSSLLLSWVQAFSPLAIVSHQHSSATTTRLSSAAATSSTETVTPKLVDERTGKPTGLSFLPQETIDRAAQGSPVEKVKLAKDGTSAFVDVYEYARKIREGEMTWEEVEKADLDSVRL